MTLYDQFKQMTQHELDKICITAISNLNGPISIKELTEYVLNEYNMADKLYWNDYVSKNLTKLKKELM